MTKDHESNIAHPFNSSHKGLLDVGLQQVRHILVNSIKRRTISESFHMAGQWNKVKGGCDWETILGTCVAKFTVNEISKFFECLPILKDKMIAQVELFESDYESLGYSTMNMEGRSRDNLVLHRRRFVFLTNSALILREEEKRKLKIDNSEKAVASELKRKAEKEERKRNPQPKKNSDQLILKIKIPRVLE